MVRQFQRNEGAGFSEPDSTPVSALQIPPGESDKKSAKKSVVAQKKGDEVMDAA